MNLPITMADWIDRESWIARLIMLAITSGLFAASVTGQNMKATIRHIPNDFSVTEFDSPAWREADALKVSTYWNGIAAPPGRRFNVQMLWSASALYVRFEAAQSEPLVVSDKPQLAEKTMNLWDRDVVEIFLAPDRKQPRKYLEFEVAPTGEWIDLTIDYSGKQRKTDWDFRSGMTSAAKIEQGTIFMAMRIPWTAFGVEPKAGDVWAGNLFRCVGKDPTRGYLAWSPTMTAQANFHVPEKFGKFEFTK